MQLYAITDRTSLPSPVALIERVAQWAAGGVDFVQIREKDLCAADLTKLAADIVDAVRSMGGNTRVLLNGEAEIAATTGCDGIHLPSHLPPSAIAAAKAVADGIVSVSCHTLPEVERARDQGADIVLFAPVFEKRLNAQVIIPGQGLPTLADACRAAAPLPVFALGGITVGNAGDCVKAGAAGVAAIRLFASDEWRSLR